MGVNVHQNSDSEFNKVKKMFNEFGDEDGQNLHPYVDILARAKRYGQHTYHFFTGNTATRSV